MDPRQSPGDRSGSSATVVVRERKSLGLQITQVLLGAVLIGAAAYLYFADQLTFWPMLLTGVGLSFMPWRAVAVIGGVVCLAAGGYWLFKHGQGGLLYGAVAIVLGGWIILDRLRRA